MAKTDVQFSALSVKLKSDKNEFLFQFQSHPNYPSALAFSDTLNFLGVKNNAYNLEKEYWGELPEEFITIYENNSALIKKDNTSFKVYSEEEITITKEELFKNSTDFVALYEGRLVGCSIIFLKKEISSFSVAMCSLSCCIIVPIFACALSPLFS